MVSLAPGFMFASQARRIMREKGSRVFVAAQVTPSREVLASLSKGNAMIHLRGIPGEEPIRATLETCPFGANLILGRRS